MGGSRIPHVEARPGRQKKCVVCKEWFPAELFPRDRGNPDGRRNECKACRSERRWARRHSHGSGRSIPEETLRTLRGLRELGISLSWLSCVYGFHEETLRRALARTNVVSAARLELREARRVDVDEAR